LPPRPEEEQIRNSEFYKLYLEEKNGLGGKHSRFAKSINPHPPTFLFSPLQWQSKEPESQQTKIWQVTKS